jgi:hypothetical protein
LTELCEIGQDVRVYEASPEFARRLFAEFLGTGLLVTVIVGSGIAAQQLSPSETGLQLLENSTATALGLAVLILMLGPVSGAHFNPLVSLADWFLGRRLGAGSRCLSLAHTRSRSVPAESSGRYWPTSCSTSASTCRLSIALEVGI